MRMRDVNSGGDNTETGERSSVHSGSKVGSAHMSPATVFVTGFGSAAGISLGTSK